MLKESIKNILILACIQLIPSFIFAQECKTPQIEFIYPYGYDEIEIELYEDNKLKTTVTTKATICSLGLFNYGHDFRIVLKKKKFTTKIVEVYAKTYDRIGENVLEVLLGGKLERKKNFRSQKPFTIPVAIVQIDSSGILNYDNEYIETRKKEINKYRKRNKG